MNPAKLIPIIFSTDMARANMNGSKRMTRRTRALDEMNADPDSWVRGTMYVNKKGEVMQTFFGPGMTERGINVKCPYGKPGDVMWMRETWALSALRNRYLADYDWTEDEINFGESAPWKPNLHMPLEACRFFAEIEEIRCERLHDISEEDMIEEGLSTTLREHDAVMDLHHQWKDLWQSINGPESWEANPYVWVVKYRRLDAEELTWKLPALLLNQKAYKQQRIRRAVMNYRLMNGKEAAV